MNDLDFTHDPARRSWLLSANGPDTDFPIQNLPYCVFRRRGTSESYRVGVGIGDQVVDLACLSVLPLLGDRAAEVACAGTTSSLNAIMATGQAAWRSFRREISQLLAAGSPAERMVRDCLVSLDDVEFKLPVEIGDFTDFFSSIYHAENVGKISRREPSLPPNYKWAPIAYHGRASTIRVSGTPIRRPLGQRFSRDATSPAFEPTRNIDFEMELGFFIGVGNQWGCRIDIEDADTAIFGACVLNDWSARDFQAWESHPLGPFLSKNFATSISPWIVTMDALAPYRSNHARSSEGPAALPYLASEKDRNEGALDIFLEASIRTARMRDRNVGATAITRSNFRDSYWTIAQMVAHHTANGCDLRAGDLLGTGTQSGPTRDQGGSMLELTDGGRSPLSVGDEYRRFLEDGDQLAISAWCQREGRPRIGFGEVSGEIQPALSPVRSERGSTRSNES